MKPLLFFLLPSSAMFVSQAQIRVMKEPGLQDKLLLYNYRPQSIFKIPKTQVLKAKYPGRFELWCGLDFSGSVPSATIAELERM